MKTLQDLTEQLTYMANASDTASSANVLRWAALHIGMQQEALEEARAELAEEEAERMRLESVLHQAQTAIEAALHTVRYGHRAPIDVSRDMSGHINLMAGHGDPDYLTKSGNSIRHVDLREKPPRKARATK